MRKTNITEKVTSSSLWNIATPSAIALKMPLYGLEAGHFYAEPGYKVEREYLDSFLLLYSVKGTGIVNGTDLPAGAAIIIDCHKPHSYETGSGDRESDNWEFYWLHFMGNSAPSLYELYTSVSAGASSVSKDFEPIFSAIVETFYIQSTQSLLKTSESIQTLISELLCGPSSTDSKDFDKALEFIHANYMKQITVEEIASTISLSKYHFIRTFKQTVGVTPYSYLLNYRINMAKRMLIETNLSIEEISHLSGFLDTANFISKFKAHTGFSPLKYRTTI